MLSEPQIDPTMLRDVIGWDVRTWQRALPMWSAHLPQWRPLRALAIGERNGGLSLWLALQGIQVHCTDLYRVSEDTMALHRRYGVSSLVTYGREDATSLTHGDEVFDVVVFKSVIGALATKERQAWALYEMHRVLKTRGVLLFAENICGTALHRWLRQCFVGWSKNWRYLDVKRDRDLFARFARLNDASTGLLSLLGQRELQRDLLARLDALLLPLTPRTWHTVWFGVATK